MNKTRVSARDLEKFGNIKTEQGGAYDFGTSVKTNAMRSLKVASLALVKEIDIDNALIKVSPFPLLVNEREKIISCYVSRSFKERYLNNLREGDSVLVLFLDRNYIQNYMQFKSGQKLTCLSNNMDLHSDRFGVVIDMM